MRHPEPETLIVDELDLGGLVRVDVAAVNGALWGYEIKSERDTLRRLPVQVEVYSKVLDYAVLVVAERHYEHAIGLLSDWWHVIIVTGDADNVVLAAGCPGSKNTGVDALHISQLLWRDEALAELTERGLDRGVRSKPRRAVWARAWSSRRGRRGSGRTGTGRGHTCAAGRAECDLHRRHPGLMIRLLLHEPDQPRPTRHPC